MKTLWLLFFVFGCFFVYSQDYTYGIYYKKNKIGQLKIFVENKNNVSNYEVRSNVKGPFNITFAYVMMCTYEDGVLKNSNCETFTNGKKRSSVNTKRKGSYYDVNIDGKKSKFNELIKYSGSLQYMNEPLDIHTSIYSDMEGSVRLIERLSGNMYKFTNPKKKRNVSVYQYEEGILERAVYDYGLYTIMIKRQ